MTNQALRPDRRGRARRWRAVPTPLLVMLGVWLSSLAGIAGSIVVTKPEERPELWGPLRWISQDPGPAVMIVTAAASLVAGWLWRREQTVMSAPQPGTSLVGMLTRQRPVPVTRAESAQARRELLGRVRRTWIEGVLDRSLAQVARIELGLAEQPNAVDPPWGTLLRQPGHPDQQLPPGTRLSQIAGRFDKHLLVLGAPGAGKTTLLAEYARDLLDQADHEPTTRIPVIFHLSGWPADKPPLDRWLVAELGRRYGVSRRLAEVLVEQDRLAVLLDGLDEVPLQRRKACVAAVNGFRGEHGGVPLVVCARSREYQELAAKLAVNGAVEVQPLDRVQVRRWLEAAGRPLAGLRATLRDREHWLWGLLDSPLLLSIAALTYPGQPARTIRANGSITVLLGAYVEKMLARPRAPLVAPKEQVVYQDADTLRWLAWLAKRMGSESVFYPDWMQPDWLPARWQQWLVTTGVGLGLGLIVGSVVGPGVGLVVGPGVGLVVGLVVGLGVGLIAGLTRRGTRIEPVEPPQWSWAEAGSGLVVGLGLGLAAGLGIGWVVKLTGGVAGRVAGGLVVGLGLGLAGAILGGLQLRPDFRPAAPLEGIRAAARAARILGLVVGLGGLLVGLGVGLAGGLAGTPSLWAGGLSVGLAGGLALGLVGGLVSGLVVGLGAGGASYLRHHLLCALLRRHSLIPTDLVGFLDYADSRILLRRAGGGYLFVHRLLQDHFAAQASRAVRTQQTM